MYHRACYAFISYIIRPVLLYRADVLIINEDIQRKLTIFGNKVLKKYLALQMETKGGEWMCKDRHVVTNVRSEWTRWAEGGSGKPEGKTPWGRPERRQWDQVILDTGVWQRPGRYGGRLLVRVNRSLLTLVGLIKISIRINHYDDLLHYRDKSTKHLYVNCYRRRKSVIQWRKV